MGREMLKIDAARVFAAPPLMNDSMVTASQWRRRRLSDYPAIGSCSAT